MKTINHKDDLVATLAVPPFCYDLYGTLFVSPKNLMQGKFNIIALGDSHLDSTMTIRVPDNNNLTATLSVRAETNNDFKSKLEVKYRGNSDLWATMIPMSSEFIDAMLEIRPNGRMFGIFDIIEPPRITERLNPIKDATTRSLEEYKYINYGKTSTMLVGNSNGDIQRSFLGFDFGINSDSLVIEKAKLKVYYSGNLKNKHALELWTVDRDWHETGITDANRPLSDTFLTNQYTINEVDRYIEFEVLNYVRGVASKEIDGYGVIIQSNNNSDELTDSLFTRESSRKPELEFTYFDTRVWSTGRAELNSEMFVYGTGRSELNAMLDVKTDWDDNTLSATLFVHRYDTPEWTELDSTIAVSMPELQSFMTTVQTGSSDLDSRIAVRRDRIEDRTSLLTISNPELRACVFVKHYDELEAQLHIRAYEENDFQSIINVSNPEIQSIFEVKYRDDLEAHITIQQNIEETIFGNLATSNPELVGHLTPRVIRDNDLTSVMSVRVSMSDELTSTLSVGQPELISAMVIRAVGNEDLESTLTPKFSVSYELDSFLTISNPVMSGELNPRVIRVNDLTSTLTAYTLGMDELISTLGVSSNELSGTFTPRVFRTSDLESEISICQFGEYELHASLSVSNNELNGFLNVVETSDLDGTILIYQNDESLFESNLSVNYPELHATMIVQMIEDFGVTLEVSHPVLQSKMTIRAFGTSNLEGFLHPRVLQANDLSATLSTENKYRSGAYYYIM